MPDVPGARDVVGRFDEDSVPEDGVRARRRPLVVRFSDRERLAMEFAERFRSTTSTMSEDAALWERLHAHFSDDELVELACCAGAHLVNGRINRVFDVEGDCSIRPVIRFPEPAAASALRGHELMDDEARVNELLDKLLAEHDPKTEPVEEFLGAQFDFGLAWVHYPEGHGGLERRAEAAGGGQPTARGGGRAGRLRRATRSGSAWARPRSSPTAPRSRSESYLRPLFTGEEMWCQLFSEPGAGSDVAGLSTTRRARRRRVDRERSEGVDVARALREAGACSSPAPTPTSRSTRASPTSSSTWTSPASRSGRCGR